MKLGVFGVLFLALASLAAQERVRPAQALQPELTLEQFEILRHMSLVTLDDGTGNPVRTLRITGLNVQIVNGTGATASANGAGNLIVGYNEPGSPAGDVRTGSHNIVTGTLSSFASHGGIVAGYDNRILAPFASVTGGQLNRASGFVSSVSGGQANRAEGPVSSVAGGCQNVAIGYTSKVCGGIFNEAQGADSTIAGGISNVVRYNCQGGSISGGRGNAVEEFAHFATVSGGKDRVALDIDDWTAGSLYEGQ